MEAENSQCYDFQREREREIFKNKIGFLIRNLNKFLEYKIEIKTKTMSSYTGLREIF